MTKLAVSSLLLLVAASGASINSYAATPTAKEEYELQVRCGKQIEEFHKKEFGNGVVDTKDGQAIASYTNHYNKKLNKCFYLQTYRNIPYKEKTTSASLAIMLADFNENREFGTFYKRDIDSAPIDCKVSGNICRSEKEWDALVAPFMND